MRLFTIAACCGLFVLPWAGLVAAQTAPQPPAVAPTAAEAERAEKLNERNRIWNEAVKLRAAGKFKEALDAGRRQHAIELEVQSPDHNDLRWSMGWLAEVCELLEDWPAAEGYRAGELAWCEKYRGTDHWRTVNARLAVEELQRVRDMTPGDRAKRQRAMRDIDTASRLHGEGKYAEALAAAVAALTAFEEVWGPKHRQVGLAASWVGVCHYSLKDDAQAELYYERTLENYRAFFGDTHVSTALGLTNLAELYERRREYARAEPLYAQALRIRRLYVAEDALPYANLLYNVAGLYRNLSQPQRAVAYCVEVIRVQNRAGAGSTAICGHSHSRLGDIYNGLRNFESAQEHYVAALAIYEKLYGTNHDDYAVCLGKSASMHEAAGRYVEAKQTYQKALETYRSLYGEQHMKYAECLHKLANLHRLLSDYAAAEVLYREALQIKKQTIGENTSSYAATLSGLAGVCSDTGDHVQALELYRQVRDLYASADGKQTNNYAITLNNLASVYHATGWDEQAKAAYQEAVEIQKQVLGERHPSYATTLANLASTLLNLGEFDEAERLLVQSLSIRRQVLGEAHPDFASGLSSLASLYKARGLTTVAEGLRRQVADRDLHADGPGHASALMDLAEIAVDRGENGRAADFYCQALQIARRMVDAMAIGQSETRQLVTNERYRLLLDAFVHCAIQSGASPKAVYEEALSWKGATLVRQRAMRQAAGDPAIAALFTQLQAATARLAVLRRAEPEDYVKRGEWRRQVEAVVAEKDALEAQISQKTLGSRAAGPATLSGLLKALPPDVVLVDFLEYWPFPPQRKSRFIDLRPDSDRQLIAFVIRPSASPEQQVAIVPLGSTTATAQAVGRWRESFGIGPDGEAAGAELRRLVWQPVEETMNGQASDRSSFIVPTSDFPTILISPDGLLGQVPFEALPGHEPGTYLIEDYRIAMIPVPQLIPALLKTDESSLALNELLLLGDVDYDAVAADAPAAVPKKKQPLRPGQRASSPTDGLLFDHLANTGGEIATIEKLFTKLFETKSDDPLTLSGRGAAEARFRALAPRYRHLHLATHGFFSDEDFFRDRRMVIADRVLFGPDHEFFGQPAFSPGMRSGLALAGANLEQPAEGDDGILTAQEIAAINLSGTDTVVLSACDTGLGEKIGSEGLLGVQRAFQVAGARTTVASLWKVDDLVTRLLMERFYRNLWEGEMSRLDALREAQLYVLNHPEALRGSDSQQADPKLRTSPRYWAAFTLSGDWR